MVQQLKPQPYSTGPLTIGGIRVLFSRKNGTKYDGYRFMGVVHDTSFEAIKEIVEHYSAASGQNVKDWEAYKKLGYKLGFQADEFSAENLRAFLFSSAPEDVEADAVAEAGPEELIAGKTGDMHGLEFGRQTTAQVGDLTVYNDTDKALLTIDVDYEIVIQYGLTFIKLLVDTHAGDTIRVGEGATSADEYHYTELAHRALAPMAGMSQEGKVIFQGVAKKGVCFEWLVAKAQITPDGEFKWDAENPSSMKFAVEILDNSESVPAAPMGDFKFYGYDDAGAAQI